MTTQLVAVVRPDAPGRGERASTRAGRRQAGFAGHGVGRSRAPSALHAAVRARGARAQRSCCSSPWLLGGLPGGVDSAFLYSSLPLFASYGATEPRGVASPAASGRSSSTPVYWLLAMADGAHAQRGGHVRASPGLALALRARSAFVYGLRLSG